MRACIDKRTRMRAYIDTRTRAQTYTHVRAHIHTRQTFRHVRTRCTYMSTHHAGTNTQLHVHKRTCMYIHGRIFLHTDTLTRTQNEKVNLPATDLLATKCFQIVLPPHTTRRLIGQWGPSFQRGSGLPLHKFVTVRMRAQHLAPISQSNAML